MAWTYYTAPLAEGEELTAAMWYELCEALAERLSATGQTEQVDLTAAAAIRDAGLAMLTVPISTSGAAAVMTSWLTILTYTPPRARWAVDASSTTQLTNAITSTEWEAEGLTESEWTAVKNAAVFDKVSSRHFWNVLRASIMRLDIMIVPATTATQTSKNGSDGSSWSGAVADYIASTETSSTATGVLLVSFRSAYSDFSTDWDTDSVRLLVDYSLPEADPLEESEAWVFARHEVVNSSVADTLEWQLGGASSSASLVDTGTAYPKLALGTALDLRGDWTFDLRLGSYADPTPYDPTSGDFTQDALMPLAGYIFIKPAWVRV